MKSRIASLHLHPGKSGQPMLAAPALELVATKGIATDPRYFGRTTFGKPSKRQVTLIEREQISEHAAVLGLKSLPPGIVRSNIETEGLDLIALLGQQIQIGDAILELVEPRTPCRQMDDIAPGLRQLMENNRQGVIARILSSGTIRVGDPIHPVNATAPENA